MTAQLDNRDGVLHIVHPDGSAETISQLITRVCKDLPQALQGDMKRITISRQGNFRLAFDNDYFPRTQGNDQAYNDKVRGLAIARRWAIIGRVTEELVRLGFEVGSDFSPRDTYQGQDNRYYPTTQMWCNTTSVRASSGAASQVTDEELLTNAFTADPTAAEAIVEGYDEEKGLTTIMRARLKALLGKAKVVEAADATDDSPAPEDGDEMPTD